MDIPTNSSEKEIEIKLQTDLGEEYQWNQNVYSLPLRTNTEKLSTLLNKLLKQSAKYAFYINGIKLETNLAEFVSKDYITTTENIIEVFYMLEMNEPQLSNTIKEDEWIRSIELLKEMKVSNKYMNYAVGWFNGEISFYNGSTNVKEFNLPNTSNPNNEEDVCSILTDIKYFKSVHNNNSLLIRTMRNSKFTFELFDINYSSHGCKWLYANLKKSYENFNSIDINPSNYDLFCLGGNDGSKGSLEIFKIPEWNLNMTKNPKKRKIESNYLSADFTFDNLHNTTVDHCAFLSREYLMSTGDDFMINLFNVTNKNLYMTFNTNYKSPSCIHAIDQNTFLVGYQDGVARLYDIKSQNKSVLQFKDKTFCGYVSDISWCQDKEKHPTTFVTSNYDSSLKVWDLRGSSAPVYTIDTKLSEKNYTVEFNGMDWILSGGDDSSVNIFKY